MKTKHLLATIFASALLVLSSSAVAQQEAPRNALRAGESALSFQVPSGGNPYVDPQGSDDSVPDSLLSVLSEQGARTILGYHYMLTDNIRGGLNLGFTLRSTTPRTVNAEGELEDGDGATAFGLTLAPQINYYTSTRGTVAPYFFGQVLFSTFSDGNDDTTGDFEEAFDDDELSYSEAEASHLDLALGMGVEWFPVTRLSISGQVGLNLNILSPDRVETEAGVPTGVTGQGFGLNLFTSALAANIYF